MAQRQCFPLWAFLLHSLLLATATCNLLDERHQYNAGDRLKIRRGHPSDSTSCVSSPVETSVTSTAGQSTPGGTSTPNSNCSSTFSLVGASEVQFNKKGAPITLKLPCPILDVNNYTAFVNWGPLDNTTNTADSITLSNPVDGNVVLAVSAMDTSGKPFFQSFSLLSGDIDMPLLVLSPDGKPAKGAYVQANATTNPGIGQSGTTDSDGRFTFVNLADTTISIFARTDENQISVDAVVPSSDTITLNLTPFNTPSTVDNNDFELGTEGWTGGNITTHVEKRDNDLVVSTGGSQDVQSASRTFNVKPSTKSVYIRYKFVTEEVPGGYFGTKYNDYFSITVRSDAGDYTYDSNSMNALGLGAFDEAGATKWYTVTLNLALSKAKSVQFDIAVSNVADDLFDSMIIVDKIGDVSCDKCDDCKTCPTNLICTDNCQNPPRESCDFYLSCAETKVPCGIFGYARKFGFFNCWKFSKTVSYFSTKGRTWIWDTMNCLQKALVPTLEKCDATCAAVESAAFASHPNCYVNSGFCELEAENYLLVLATVNFDLFSAESVDEILKTGGLCASKIVQKLEVAIEEAAVDLSKILLKNALQNAKQYFENLIDQFGLPRIN